MFPVVSGWQKYSEKTNEINFLFNGRV